MRVRKQCVVTDTECCVHPFNHVRVGGCNGACL